METHDNRLAMVLSDMATRLEPEEAARVCSRAAAVILRNPREGDFYYQKGYGLSALGTHMEPKEAARVCSQAAANHFRVMAMAYPEKINLNYWVSGLSTVLSRVDLPEQKRRISGVVTAIGLLADTSQPHAAPVVLRTIREPLPSRLSPQELVELLKHPTCMGQARRIILDLLESHYKRVFADQWAFVRYAQEEKLELDFTTPPRFLVSLAGGEKN